MLVFVMALLVQGDVPNLGAPNPRPAFECAEHVTDARARRSCLNALASAAAGDLLNAEASLDEAQLRWLQYRDAECSRRGSLMFISEQSREEIVLDCQISLDRARAAELLEH